jgi:sugar-specific transcriptional regulator TrmB
MVSSAILEQLGMSDKQARLYLATLEIGSGTVVQISRKAGITRGSTYDILEEMLEKGFVSKTDKDKHMVFSAIDPEVLMKRYQDHLRSFEMSLPELKGLFHKHSRPRVRYFEGIEGVKRVYEDTLTSTTDILNFANSRTLREYWPEYDRDYVRERIRKGIVLRGIAPDDEYGRQVRKDDKKSLRETRLLPAGEFFFTNEINIYDNKVAIASFGDELIGIIIESKEIADTQRDIFRMAWSFAEMRAKALGQHSADSGDGQTTLL